jgi:hypothetical protein
MICQHYEIPTRLVDWSTNILSPLFFACYESKELTKTEHCIYANKMIVHYTQVIKKFPPIIRNQHLLVHI